MKKISIIVPAYDEERSIANVLRPLVDVRDFDLDIVVVDDGSKSDKTFQIASLYAPEGVRVFRLERNEGKAAALNRGVNEARHETLLFLDADLTKLQSWKVEYVLRKYFVARADVATCIFRTHTWLFGRAELSQRWFGNSGQRILTKAHWTLLTNFCRDNYNEDLATIRFGVEKRMNECWARNGLHEVRPRLFYVSHVTKEQKHGFKDGLLQRGEMLRDIWKTTLTRYSPKK